jgi:hypothetical protein
MSAQPKTSVNNRTGLIWAFLLLRAVQSSMKPPQKMAAHDTHIHSLVVPIGLEIKGLHTCRCETRIQEAGTDTSQRLLRTYRMEDYYENRAGILKALDADKWLATLRHIKESGLGTPTHGMSPYKRTVNLEEFMLTEDWYGFPGIDLYVPLRLALEICAKDDNLIYDLTDLGSQEYFDKNEDFVALASEFTAREHASDSKTIILTEGRSDGWILSESMKLLYPHLSDYFSFMD